MLLTRLCVGQCVQMVWVVTQVPETKGVALEEMQAHLARNNSMWAARRASGHQDREGLVAHQDSSA